VGAGRSGTVPADPSRGTGDYGVDQPRHRWLRSGSGGPSVVPAAQPSPDRLPRCCQEWIRRRTGRCGNRRATWSTAPG